jgi:transposase
VGPSAVAAEFDVSAHTVYKWLGRYRASGIAGLQDESSAPHRVPSRLIQPGKELHEAAMELLHAPPAAHGFNCTTWRMCDLRAALATRGVTTTLNSLSAVIR